MEGTQSIGIMYHDFQKKDKGLKDYEKHCILISKCAMYLMDRFLLDVL
jgi:hypothetical protein